MSSNFDIKYCNSTNFQKFWFWNGIYLNLKQELIFVRYKDKFCLGKPFQIKKFDRECYSPSDSKFTNFFFSVNKTIWNLSKYLCFEHSRIWCKVNFGQWVPGSPLDKDWKRITKRDMSNHLLHRKIFALVFYW